MPIPHLPHLPLLLRLPDTGAKFPRFVHQVRRVDKDAHSWVETLADGTIAFCTTHHELDARGAWHLTAATRRNLLKGHWLHRSGLLVPQRRLVLPGEPEVQAASSAWSGWSEILYKVEKLDERRPVVILDGIGQLCVLVDPSIMDEDAAHHMTVAGRAYMADGPWRRDESTDLWLPGGVAV